VTPLTVDIAPGLYFATQALPVGAHPGPEELA
jgi:hypothetical protein